MAYLPESELERQRRMQEQGSSQSQQVATGQPGVITGTAQAAPSSPQGQAPGTRSGAYTNINQYIQANRPQTQQLAQKVTSNLGTQYNQAKTQVDAAKNNFTTQVNQGSVQKDDALLGDVRANPTSITGDQSRLAQFTKMRDARYQGPSNLSDVAEYGKAAQSVQNAQSALDNTQTEAGRFSLIQEQFKRPDYSRGQQRLDQALLQNTPEARQEFESARSRFAGVNDYLGQAKTQSQQLAEQKRLETSQAAQGVKDTLGSYGKGGSGAFGDIYSQLDQARNTATTDQASLIARAREQLSKGELDSDIAASLGIKDGDFFGGADLNTYANSLEAMDNDITQADVASDDQLQRLESLKMLSGFDDGSIQLGAKEGNRGIDFRSKDAFTQDLSASQAAAQKAYENTQFTGSTNAIGAASQEIGKLIEPAYLELQKKLAATTNPNDNIELQKQMQQLREVYLGFAGGRDGKGIASYIQNMRSGPNLKVGDTDKMSGEQIFNDYLSKLGGNTLTDRTKNELNQYTSAEQRQRIFDNLKNTFGQFAEGERSRNALNKRFKVK